MAKEMCFPLDNKPLLDDLLRLQTEISTARDQGDEVLARLHEMDFNMCLQKLKVTPCSICYHGDGHTGSKCHLWSRCQSVVKVERVWVSDTAACLSLSLIFEVV